MVYSNSCKHTILFLIAGEKEYYEKQFATLRSFEEVDSLHNNAVDESLELEEQSRSEFAMKISNYANISLLALKVIDSFVYIGVLYIENMIF